jgi:hypothetical protein
VASLGAIQGAVLFFLLFLCPFWRHETRICSSSVMSTRVKSVNPLIRVMYTLATGAEHSEEGAAP